METEDWGGSQVTGLGDWVGGSAINEEREYRRKSTLRGRAHKIIRSSWETIRIGDSCGNG